MPWPVEPVPEPGLLRDRLSETEVAALVAAYRSGDSARVLAEQFGISMNSVLRLLRRRGVDIRPSHQH